MGVERHTEGIGICVENAFSASVGCHFLEPLVAAAAEHRAPHELTRDGLAVSADTARMCAIDHGATGNARAAGQRDDIRNEAMERDDAEIHMGVRTHQIWRNLRGLNLSSVRYVAGVDLLDVLDQAEQAVRANTTQIRIDQVLCDDMSVVRHCSKSQQGGRTKPLHALGINLHVQTSGNRSLGPATEASCDRGERPLTAQTHLSV